MGSLDAMGRHRLFYPWPHSPLTASLSPAHLTLPNPLSANRKASSFVALHLFQHLHFSPSGAPPLWLALSNSPAAFWCTTELIPSTCAPLLGATLNLPLSPWSFALSCKLAMSSQAVLGDFFLNQLQGPYQLRIGTGQRILECSPLLDLSYLHKGIPSNLAGSYILEIYNHYLTISGPYMLISVSFQLQRLMDSPNIGSLPKTTKIM